MCVRRGRQGERRRPDAALRGRPGAPRSHHRAAGARRRTGVVTMTRPLPESEAVRRLHAQSATARALMESASLHEAAPRILKAICETLGWEHGALWRVDAAAGHIRCVETWHSPSVSFPRFEK